VSGFDLVFVLFGICFGGYQLLMLSLRRRAPHADRETVVGRIRSTERVGSEDQILTVDFVDGTGRRRQIRRRGTGPRRRRTGSTVPVIIDRTDPARAEIGTTGADRATEVGFIIVFGLVPIVIGFLGEGEALAEAMSATF